jgi:hypothetical protein
MVLTELVKTPLNKFFGEGFFCGSQFAKKIGREGHLFPVKSHGFEDENVVAITVTRR